MRKFSDGNELIIKSNFISGEYIATTKEWILAHSINPNNNLQPEFDICDDDRVIAKKIRKLYWYDSQFWDVWLNESGVMGLVNEFFKSPVLIKHAAFIKRHVDESYIPLHQDIVLWEKSYETAITFWVALTESKKENGCMFYYPGIRKIYPHVFDIDYPSFKCISHSSSEIEKSKYVDIEVEEGTVVIWPSILPHGSYQNSAGKLRIGMPLVFAEKSEIERYEKENFYVK